MGESVVVEEEEEEVGAMGGEGAVKLSTQFTQTALSARLEPLHCQTNEEEEEVGSWGVEGDDGEGEGGREGGGRWTEDRKMNGRVEECGEEGREIQ